MIAARLALCVLLFLLLVRRRRWPAVAASLVVLTAALADNVAGGDWLGILTTALFAGIVVAGLTRFGLVALATGSFVQRLIVGAPWTLDGGAWYAWEAWLAGAGPLGLAGVGFRGA